MSTKIVFVTDFPDAADVAREMAPSGVELAVVPARSAEYEAAMSDAEYLVGFVDGLVDNDLFKVGPNLKLIQLLSAGYDKADISAARNAGVPICNNGGANSVAVSEHAILLMLAVSRQLVRQHTSVAAGRWRGNVDGLYGGKYRRGDGAFAGNAATLAGDRRRPSQPGNHGGITWVFGGACGAGGGRWLGW